MTRFSTEAASATPLWDEPSASVPLAQCFTAEDPPVLFHPFNPSSGMLDLALDDLGLIDFDVMDACNLQASSHEGDSMYDL